MTPQLSYLRFLKETRREGGWFNREKNERL
jgi:hypothetical protein